MIVQFFRTIFISYVSHRFCLNRRILWSVAQESKRTFETRIFDKWDSGAGTDLLRFIQKIDNVNYVAAVGTPAYLAKYEDDDRDAVVSAELGLIAARLSRRPSESSDLQATVDLTVGLI